MADEVLKSVKKIDKKQKTVAKKPNPIKRFTKYIKDIIAELKRVTWPTRKELVNSTIAVIIFVLVLAAFTGALDFIYANLMKLIVR